MLNFLKKSFLLLDSRALYLINIFQIISILVCLFALLFLSLYNTYFVSILLLQAGIALMKIGICTGIFPIFFAVIITDWKQKNNL